MHKYWARKISDVVNEHIRTYSKKGDVVPYTFNGSGITVPEALEPDRKAVGVDACSTLLVFLTKYIVTNVDTSKLSSIIKDIAKSVYKRIKRYTNRRSVPYATIGRRQYRCM